MNQGGGNDQKAPRLSAPRIRRQSIEAVSDPMRELIEDLWPELVHKLPPKKPQA
jgi:hypothetical protein